MTTAKRIWFLLNRHTLAVRIKNVAPPAQLQTEPARFFNSSLRPAGVKTTILQKQTGAPDFLSVLPLALFIQSNP